MSQEQQHDPFLDDDSDNEKDVGSANTKAEDLEEELLPTISLVHVPHAKIPNLYHCCYEYVEPWQWSSEAELVETGRWFFGAAKDDP